MPIAYFSVVVYILTTFECIFGGSTIFDKPKLKLKLPFLIMEAEDDYVETPILLYKIANF